MCTESKCKCDQEIRVGDTVKIEGVVIQIYNYSGSDSSAVQILKKSGKNETFFLADVELVKRAPRKVKKYQVLYRSNILKNSVWVTPELFKDSRDFHLKYRDNAFIALIPESMIEIDEE